ncbi:MAG: STAS domain-containing protein [Actinomycetota bacterium]
MGAAFHIKLEHDDDRWTLICGGELDVATAHRLEEACDHCGGLRPRSLHIDGRDLSFIDSHGVTALIRCASLCNEEGIDLTVELSDQARDVLSRAGMAERLVLGRTTPAAPL